MDDSSDGTAGFTHHGVIGRNGAGVSSNGISGPWNLSEVASRENALGSDLELNSEQSPKN